MLIGWVDGQSVLLGRLRREAWEPEVEFALQSPEEVAGDLIVWNLSAHPREIPALLARLRQAHPHQRVILVWDGEEPLEGLIEALRHGALNALSLADGGEQLTAEIRRHVANRRQDESDDRLLQDLVDRSYSLSVVNEVLRGINESRHYQDLLTRAVEPLLEMVGATQAQLVMPHGCWPAQPATWPATLWRARLGALVGPQCARQGERYLAVFPLLAHDRAVGELLFEGPVHMLDQLEAASEVIRAIAGQIGLAVASIRMLEETLEQAVRDGLTGLYNHAHFQHQLRIEFDRARRYQETFTLMMIDVDHFKRINDTYGHQAGDACLKGVAEALKRSLRLSDLAARYGGEEFVLLLPGTALSGACILAERLRTEIQALQVICPIAGPIGRVTASFGLAEFAPVELGPQHLLRRADEALYQAKRTGRDRVCIGLADGPSGPGSERLAQR